MRRIGIIVLLSLVAGALALPAVSGAQGRTRCFAETGYCITGPILDYWERNGGLPVFGYPTSDLRIENVEGTWSGPVQWFERDRLEDHSNEGLGVLAGRLGARLLELKGQRWEEWTQVNQAPSGCAYFPQTRHSLCEPFLSYWRTNGGLARFGYPISEPFPDQIGAWRGQVQYFERRRMEHHTELAGTPYEVLLGLLGNEVRGYQAPEGCAQEVLPELRSFMERIPFRAAMGCPGAGHSPAPAANQRFQHGSLIWADTGVSGRTIWSVRDPGHPAPFFSYMVYEDSWDESQPENGGEQAPAGLVVPKRGFYKVWYGSRGEGMWLGYGMESERTDQAIVQYFGDQSAAVYLVNARTFYAFGPGGDQVYIWAPFQG